MDSGAFALTKEVSDRLHDLIARDEALEARRFRGEGTETATPSVYLGIHGRHTPPATEAGGANLRDLYAAGLAELATIDTIHGQAVGYFLFAALQQFYFDGNRRTGRAMMNGQLLTHGFDGISVPAAARAEFNAAMVEFYRTRDASPMFALMPTFGPTDR